jgi:toxin YoeB
MNLVLTARFKGDVEYWNKRDKITLKRIIKLMDAIAQTPFLGIGKPEPLLYKFSGCWSRRIDKGNRIIYRVSANTIEFLSCRFHYD